MIRVISESLEYQRVAVFVHILPWHTNSILTIEPKLLAISIFRRPARAPGRQRLRAGPSCRSGKGPAGSYRTTSGAVFPQAAAPPTGPGRSFAGFCLRPLSPRRAAATYRGRAASHRPCGRPPAAGEMPARRKTPSAAGGTPPLFHAGFVNGVDHGQQLLL